MKKQVRKHEVVKIELPKPESCSECGCIGLHYCSGKNWHRTVEYIATRKTMGEF